MNENIDSVLTFWFGEFGTAAEMAERQKSIWWAKHDETDETIKDRFAEVTDAVAGDGLEHWRESAKGLLASIICTDQFPRNMYRGDDKSFAFDEVALGLAKQAIATAADEELDPICKVFVYMPFEHSEVLEMQEKSLELFSSLEQQSEGEERELFAGYTSFARRHHEIIERFGRFPHRNVILGRKSTEEELEFLEQPGSSF